MDKHLYSNGMGEFNELGGGVRRRVRSYDGQIMGVEVDFDKGGVGAPHSHPHTQLTYCLRGEFEFVIDGSVQRLRAGEALLFPSGVQHGCVALSAGTLYDVFTPMRDDFLE